MVERMTYTAADGQVFEAEDAIFPNLKVIQLGGEKFNSSLYEKLSKNTHAKIFNGYGPTEITACCTNKLVVSNDITIGKPIANVKAYICNNSLNLMPIGVVGEICIAGARGF